MPPVSNSAVASRKCPRSAAPRPHPQAPSAAIKPLLKGWRRPRKTGNHLALKPHAASTGTPMRRETDSVGPASAGFQDACWSWPH
jgi:hypothetical protein